ncbi:MAG TPA: hypothetical protein VK176_05245 [Phycisphaerales bacterium]|nr:hypothetical protein [Phycisphaerales bacterium]
MNWLIFTLNAWVLLGLELGLKHTLRIGETQIAPSFVMPLAVTVAIAAPTTPALWASLALGAALDLTNAIETAGGGPARTILGPYALGYLVAGYLVLTMRGIMIKKNILTIGFLSMMSSLVANIVVAAIMAIRARYDTAVEFDASQQLLSRVIGSLYTGVVGTLIGAVLLAMLGTMGLTIGPARRFGRRTG